MKIIFDNEEQKDKFLDDIITMCPFHYGIKVKENQCEKIDFDCKKCWESYVEMEVKE